MLEFQEKQKVRKIIYSNWSLAIVSVVAVFMLFSVTKVYLKSREAKTRSEEIASSLEAVKARGVSLEEGINRFKGDFGTEEEIRKRFDVAKPEENVIVIIDKNEETPPPPEPEDGFLLKLWHVINIFD